MKICPFLSHMLGDDHTNVLEIDGTPMSGTDEEGSGTEDVVILGYDDGSGVATKVKTKAKTKRKTRTRTKTKGAGETSHLFCLKETCRFYVKKSGDCKFDMIFDAVDGNKKNTIDAITAASKETVKAVATVGKMTAKAVESATKNIESSDDEHVARELSKFWQFQTKSVSELIASIGENEQKQEKAFREFRKGIEDKLSSISSKTPELDLSPLTSEISGLRDSMESRDEGLDNLSATMSEVVMNIEDSVASLTSTSDELVNRIEKIENALPTAETVAKSVEEVIDKHSPSGSDDKVTDGIRSLSEQIENFVDSSRKFEDAMNSWQKRLESDVEAIRDRDSSWEERFGELTKLQNEVSQKQSEVIELVQSERDNRPDESSMRRTKEARKFNNLGVTSFHNGELEMARDQFQQAVALDDGFAESYNNLGLVYTELGEEEEATDSFSRAIEINPELHAAYNNLGYVFYKQGSYDRAIEMYNEALGRNSNNSSAYTNLGNAYFKQGNRSEARKAWEKAIELDPANEKAVRNMKRVEAD